jgi:excisionase family DNA binding protein
VWRGRPWRNAGGLIAVSLPLATVALDEATLHRVADLIAERLMLSPANGASSPWMPTPLAAEYLSLSVDALHRLSAASAIPHRKQGGRLLFNRVELDAWLDSYYHGPPRRP